MNISDFFEPFIIRALISGIICAFLAGPIGSVMIWHKTAYFSDTLSHSALLGVVLGAFLGINLNISVLILLLFLALVLLRIPQRTVLGIDIFLLIIAQTSLCLGLVGLSFLPNIKSSLEGYLFGDVLSVSLLDIYTMLIAGLLCIYILYKNWDKQLLCAISIDLAQSEKINVVVQKRIFTVLLAIFTGICFKTTGLLLVSALLIIPAATAIKIVNTPEKSVVFASVIGCLSIILGLICSVFFDVPTSPMIEIVCCIFFLFSLIKK